VAELNSIVELTDPALTVAVTELRRTLDAAGLRDAGRPTSIEGPPRGDGLVVLWTDLPAAHSADGHAM
jgi:hypothetical protein